MQRAVIVYNPVARNAPRRERLQRAAASMRERGWEIELRPTERPGHATLLAREAAASGADVVIACGGDGTVNEVVNGLVGSETALALIRGGTGNVLAKEIRTPRSVTGALRLLVDGERRRFDLGLAEPGSLETLAGEAFESVRTSGLSRGLSDEKGRYFLLMAGVGFDAEIVRKVPSKHKRILGTSAYLLWGMSEVRRYRPRPVRLRVDGEESECELYWLLLGNTRSYGGVLNITARAVADDGLLDAYVFAGRGLPWVMRTGVRLALRRQDGGAGVSFARVREVEVSTPGLAVQADGEYFGETPMRFSVAPKGVEVLMRRGAGRRLLGAE